jgi:hypothetical protein
METANCVITGRGNDQRDVEAIDLLAETPYFSASNWGLLDNLL